jgi:hypothetical protein
MSRSRGPTGRKHYSSFGGADHGKTEGEEALPNLRILMGLLISAALAPAICAQGRRQLQVEVGPSQQVRILASEVSYGEVLRALEKKLGWEIEIPPSADTLKLSYVRVETTQPQIALAKLLEGSGLGYAFLSGVNGSSAVKVVVIPSTPREASVTHDTASPISDNVAEGALSPLPAQAQAATTIQPSATTAEATTERPAVPSTMPLAQAIDAMGVPAGVSAADVGRAMMFPILDAVRIMGVPPGVSPADVGKTTTMPLPTVPGKHP